MKQRAFGATGREVCVVGQGTWPLPDVQALRAGLKLGMTHIDTAEMYGDGRSEELVGEAIRGFPREQLFLVSKLLPSNGRRADVQRSCERSLGRLGVSELDCYLLHWRGDLDLAQTMEALGELVKAGKTRSIGVSNLDPWDLREAQAAVPNIPIVCNQVMYNLAERTVEEHEYPWAREHEQALVAYTPLGGIPPTGHAAAVLQAIGQRHQVAPYTVALAFLLRLENVFVIPKASQLAHVSANAAAGTLALSADEIDALDAAFPRKTRVGPLPMN